MDTFYYFLIGILLFTMLVEISSLDIPGANGAMWLSVHFFAFIASFFYVIYIFFVEDVSSAGYTLLYTFGYILSEALLSFIIIIFAVHIIEKKNME